MIHRNLSVEEQALEVEKVKKSESGMIVDPITLHPEQRVYEALELMRRYRISGLPVVREGRLVGILTNRDLRFETDLDRPVSEVMTKEGLITARVGITLEEAKRILHQHRIEKLPVVDEAGRLRGLITIKDIEKMRQYPHACKDELGRLRVGAAVGVGEDRDRRVAALLEVARQVGRTPAQVALRWVLEQPLISSAIVGARSMEQLKDNLGAVGWRLEGEPGGSAREGARDERAHRRGIGGAAQREAPRSAREALRRGAEGEGDDIRQADSAVRPAVPEQLLREQLPVLRLPARQQGARTTGARSRGYRVGGAYTS